MKGWLTAVLWTTVAFGGHALGMSEDPSEKLSRTWKLDTIHSLEIRGEIQFEIVPGTRPRVTVETSRALFDQLTVSNWFGSATVAIESGLRGPREQGTVQVIIEVPTLGELVVLDHSSGRVTWPPGLSANLRVGENSTVTLAFEGTVLSVEGSWLSSIQVTGRSQHLSANLRHQARLDARGFAAETLRLNLDEESSLEAGPGGKATGVARHGSRMTVPSRSGWEGVVLREDSVLHVP